MSLYSMDLEQQILGSLIKDEALFDRASTVVGSEDFYDPLHQRIFSKIEKMHGSGEQVTSATMSAVMQDDPGIKSIEAGTEYFYNLRFAAPTLPNIISLARSLKELSTKRNLLTVAENISATIEDGSAQEHIEDAEKALYALAEKSQFGSRMIGFGEAVQRSFKAAQRAHEAGGRITGIPTGLVDVDTLLGGLQPSDLIILAGRPGMGKTALATNIGFHAATREYACLFFSLEMSAQQLSTRILSEQSQVEMWKIRAGRMNDHEWEKYVKSGQELNAVPLYIDDTGGLTLPQLASRARRAKREHKIELIVVDYLQLMDGAKAGSYQQNRVQEVTYITKGLKALAKELDIPVVALSQLSRGVDSRDDKRPVLSDLRESGSIEQDADIVAFVYRAEYYIKSREPDVADPLYGKWQEAMEKAHGKADLIVEKHRHGAGGVVHLAFEGKFTKFSSLAEI